MITWSVACAGALVPPFVELDVTMFTLSPIMLEVTFTVIVQGDFMPGEGTKLPPTI